MFFSGNTTPTKKEMIFETFCTVLEGYQSSWSLIDKEYFEKLPPDCRQRLITLAQLCQARCYKVNRDDIFCVVKLAQKKEYLDDLIYVLACFPEDFSVPFSEIFSIGSQIGNLRYAYDNLNTACWIELIQGMWNNASDYREKLPSIKKYLKSLGAETSSDKPEMTPEIIGLLMNKNIEQIDLTSKISLLLMHNFQRLLNDELWQRVFLGSTEEIFLALKVYASIPYYSLTTEDLLDLWDCSSNEVLKYVEINIKKILINSLRAIPEPISDDLLLPMMESLDPLQPSGQVVAEALLLLIERDPHLVTPVSLNLLIFSRKFAPHTVKIIQTLSQHEGIDLSTAYGPVISRGQELKFLAFLLEKMSQSAPDLFNQLGFNSLVANPFWQQLNQAFTYLESHDMAGALWDYWDVFINGRDEEEIYSLANQIVVHQQHTERLDILVDQASENMMLLKPMKILLALSVNQGLMFHPRVETDVSHEHDYVHQEKINKGTSKTVRALKDLYRFDINTREKCVQTRAQINAWVARQPDEHQYKLNRALGSIESFKDIEEPLSHISLGELLLLCWHAFNDKSRRVPQLSDKDAKDYFISVLSDIAPGLCVDAHFKKLIESLVSVHTSAVQSCVTLQMLQQKFPCLVREKVADYLNSVPVLNARQIYAQIKDHGISTLWEHIKQAVHDEIIEDFFEIAPTGIEHAHVQELIEHLDSVNTHIPRFEQVEPVWPKKRKI